VLVVRVFEVPALMVAGAAKRVGDVVVIVLISGLGAGRRRGLIAELLSPEELAAHNERGHP
jgi:hypothetical protein